MSHAKNKVNWCLRKAEREYKEKETHRGLVKIKSDKEEAKKFIIKAEHYLKATEYLKKGGFSDISTSTAFYTMYHCMLAIAIKQGYESRNQECTFALISSLIEDKRIDFDADLLEKISVMDVKETEEKTTTQIREQFQYGTELSIKDNLYNKLFALAQEVIAKTKEIIEE